MSVRLPTNNATIGGNAGATRGVIPTGVALKGANLGFVTGFFIRTPDLNYTNSVTYNLMSRAAGGTGGSDGYIRLNQTATTLTCQIRHSSATVVPLRTITGLTANKTYLIMLVQTADFSHLVACEPGGTPLVNSAASTIGYTTNITTNLWDSIGPGSGASLGHYGPIENAFCLTGLFPETAGVLDTTLIQNIASGVQPIATLDTQLTSGVKKYHYPLYRVADLTDAFGLAGPITFINNAGQNVVLSGGPLMPSKLRPTFCRSMTSAVQFSTPADLTTGTANVKIEGGTYTGAAPASIRARLVTVTGAVHRNWTIIDAAPSGGVYTGGTLTAVPAIAGHLTAEIAEFDGGGNQIGQIVASHGLKGVGVSMVIWPGQSQAAYLTNGSTGNGNLALPTTANVIVHVSNLGVGVVGTVANWQELILNSLHSLTRVTRGARALAIEIDAIFPGLPITIIQAACSGQGITNLIPGGPLAVRIQQAFDFVGLAQPTVQLHLGNSSGTDTNYGTHLGQCISQFAGIWGAPLKVIHCLLPRYSVHPNDSDTAFCRRRTLEYIAANPSTNYIGASMHNIKNENGDDSPHSGPLNTGQGRLGAQIAWAYMMWSRMVLDRPKKLTAAVIQVDTTKHQLVYSDAN